MSPPGRIWAAFIGFVAVVLLATGSATVKAFRLERREVRHLRDAAREENVRLALWRMDSRLGGLMAVENARPPEAYEQLFSPAGAAAENPFATARRQGTFSFPISPFVRYHFLITSNGRVAFPVFSIASATRNSRQNASPAKLPFTRDRLLRALDAPQPEQDIVPNVTQERQAASPPAQQAAPQEETFSFRKGKSRYAKQAQSAISQAEYRNRMASNAFNEEQADGWHQPSGQRQILEPSAPPSIPQRSATSSAVEMASRLPFPRETGRLQAIWVEDRLVLVRAVPAATGGTAIQGCLLDWPALREMLLAEIADLLPQADLEPVEDATEDTTRLLASIPARLLPGRIPGDDADEPSLLFWSLGATWGAVLLAVMAVGLLLRGVLALSERRAAFVSAVTHELRTPLTTFRMYTEMLAGGMLTDAEKRRRYVNTLHNEALRLSHLVENVLAFARVERGRSCPPVGPVFPAKVVDRHREGWEGRCAQAGITLSVSPELLDDNVCVLANEEAVGRILYNLIDNACKYATREGGTVSLSLRIDGDEAEWTVADNGPGFAPNEMARIFQPFWKSAHCAADTAPGVGLGLALGRRLARAMGGDLLAGNALEGGACLRLRLRLRT